MKDKPQKRRKIRVVIFRPSGRRDYKSKPWRAQTEFEPRVEQFLKKIFRCVPE